MKRVKILVIGSAHIDVLAEFDDSDQKTEIDKIGNSVSFGFGGTALNIAAHLQELKHKPFVMTSLNKSSTGLYLTVIYRKVSFRKLPRFAATVKSI